MLVWRQSCGVPFRPERWFIRYSPVSRLVRDGPQGVHWPKWLRKITPSAARESIFGVFTTG
jgi:hypothetical protein